MAKNPFFQKSAPAVSESNRAALRTIVATYLQANSDQAVIADAVVQALHPALAQPAVFQAIKDDLGL